MPQHESNVAIHYYTRPESSIQVFRDLSDNVRRGWIKSTGNDIKKKRRFSLQIGLNSTQPGMIVYCHGPY